VRVKLYQTEQGYWNISKGKSGIVMLDGED